MGGTGTRARVGPRERRKLEARRALSDAALRLFARKGYEATTIGEIARAAGYSPRTFFRYFRSKDDVVFGNGRDYPDLVLACLLRRPPSETPFEALAEALVDHCAVLDEQPEAVLARVRLIESSQPLRARRADEMTALAAVLASGLAARGGRSEPGDRDRLAAALAVAAFACATEAWCERGGSGSLAGATRAMLDGVVREVCGARRTPPSSEERPT
ncbi:MAG TPA: TetR family transcriptional regulator [Actinomycetota bacterium]|nr:TetR family transcriptional regulator [Actinomycetota bacterium]